MKKKEQTRRARAKAQAQAERDKSSVAESCAVGENRSGAGIGVASKREHGPGTDGFKREQSIKTAKWNRFMLIRYLDAGLFFVGLYWLFMLLAFQPSFAAVVPLLEVVLALAVMVEVFTTLSREVEYLKWSHRALIASCAVSTVALVATLAVGEKLFPFFSSKMVGAIFCAALIAVKLIIIYRIVLVRDRRDKRYALYQKILKYNN